MVSKNSSMLVTDRTVAPEPSPPGRRAKWRPRLPCGSEEVDIISSARGPGRARQQLSLLSSPQRPLWIFVITTIGLNYSVPRSPRWRRRKGEVDFPSTLPSCGSVSLCLGPEGVLITARRLCNQQMLPLGSPERANCADARLGVPASAVPPTRTHGAIKSRADAAPT